jgi:uncharacterized protein with ParB-like and HNH nuclease domain
VPDRLCRRLIARSSAAATGESGGSDKAIAWDDARQSKFIESVLLGLPIPYIFVADIPDEENEARLEIIDGTQRIRTLAKVLNNELKLEDLKKLKKLNDFRFSDLPLPRQRRFKRTTLRMIQLTEKATEDIRRDMFERINTGGVVLSEIENAQAVLMVITETIAREWYRVDEYSAESYLIVNQLDPMWANIIFLSELSPEAIVDPQVELEECQDVWGDVLELTNSALLQK